MDFKRYDITPGASIGVVDTDKFKVNDLWISFVSPLSRDTAALNSLLPMVLTRGTASLPDMLSISKRLDNLYAATISPRGVKRAETHMFGFFASMLGNEYAIDGCDIAGEVISTLREIITDPVKAEGVFKPEFVEGEKKVLCSYISSEINNKRRYAVTRCIEEMCRGEAFGIADSGRIEDVCAITPETLWEHYKKVVSGMNVEAFYVGRYSDAVADCAASLLKGIGSSSKTAYDVEVKRSAEKVKRVIEDHPVRQGKLCLGYRTGRVLSDADFHKLTVFNAVFGASPVSKLFMNVREKLSLAYYCSSFICDPRKGIMLVNAGIDPANLEKTEEEVARQLDLIAKGEITDAELDAAKASIVNSYREMEDIPSAFENWYTVRMMAGRSDSPAENARRILSVTKEDVSEAARGVSLDTIYFMNPTLNG
ncbi:MAG: insulinase family protein, partial [Clostridia bacterium]|nr:insulinase family protein [Clostridia bacterium]